MGWRAARGEIDDGEAAVSERDSRIGVGPLARVVGSARFGEPRHVADDPLQLVSVPCAAGFPRSGQSAHPRPLTPVLCESVGRMPGAVLPDALPAGSRRDSTFARRPASTARIRSPIHEWSRIRSAGSPRRGGVTRPLSRRWRSARRFVSEDLRCRRGDGATDTLPRCGLAPGAGAARTPVRSRHPRPDRAALRRCRRGRVQLGGAARERRRSGRQGPRRQHAAPHRLLLLLLLQATRGPNGALKSRCRPAKVRTWPLVQLAHGLIAMRCGVMNPFATGFGCASLRRRQRGG